MGRGWLPVSRYDCLDVSSISAVADFLLFPEDAHRYTFLPHRISVGAVLGAATSPYWKSFATIAQAFDHAQKNSLIWRFKRRRCVNGSP